MTYSLMFPTVPEPATSLHLDDILKLKGEPLAIVDDDDVSNPLQFIFDKSLREQLESFHRYGSGPDDNKSPFTDFYRRKLVWATGKSSLTTCYSEESQQLRSLITEYLHKYASNTLEVIPEVCAKHTDMWLREGRVRIYGALRDLLVEITLKGILGYDGDPSQISGALREVVYMPYTPPLNLKEKKELENTSIYFRSYKYVKEWVFNVFGIAYKLVTFKSSLSQLRNCAQDLIKTNCRFAQFMKEKGVSDEVIIDNIITLIITGEESLSSLLVCVLEQYLQHPELQQKDHDEIVQNGSTGPRKTFLETMRLYPPAIVLRSIKGWMAVKKEDANYITPLMPTGFCYAGLTCRDPKEWGENAAVFDRERPDLEKVTHLPFGSGAHSCPGKQIAIKEGVEIICQILAKARICRIDEMPPLILQMLTFKPKNDFWMSFKKF